jgi:hypothetical protein
MNPGWPILARCSQGWAFHLEGNVRRAIDIHEGDKVDEAALKDLIRAAVALNLDLKSKGKSKPKPRQDPHPFDKLRAGSRFRKNAKFRMEHPGRPRRSRP